MHLAKSGKLFLPGEAYPNVGRTCLVITWAGQRNYNPLFTAEALK